MPARRCFPRRLTRAGQPGGTGEARDAQGIMGTLHGPPDGVGAQFQPQEWSSNLKVPGPVMKRYREPGAGVGSISVRGFTDSGNGDSPD